MQYKRIVVACLVVILTLCATIFTVGAETPLEVAVGVDNSTPTVVNSGEEFKVSVTMNSNPGLAIFKLELAYDTVNLEYVKAENGKVFTDASDIIKIKHNDGTVKYECIGSTDVTTAEATIVTVTFKAKSTINPESSVMVLADQISASNAQMTVLYGSKFGSTAKAISIKGNPATLHTHTLAVMNVEATCDENASTHYLCSGCDYVHTVVAENTAKKHTAGAWVTVKEATPDSIGYKTQSCTVCQKLLATETINALGHTYESVVTEPTCTDKGYTTHTCKSCTTPHSYVDTFTDKVAHTEEKIAAVDATCTTAGSTEGKKCSVCEAILVAPEVVQPVGHKTEKIAAVEPTTEAAGASEGEKCTVCDEVTVKPVELAQLAKPSMAWLVVLIVFIVLIAAAAVALFFLVFKKDSMYERKIRASR